MVNLRAVVDFIFLGYAKWEMFVLHYLSYAALWLFLVSISFQGPASP